MIWKETDEGYETALTFQKYGRAKEAVDELLHETNGALFAGICYRRKEKPSTYYLFLGKEYLREREYIYDGQTFVSMALPEAETFFAPGVYVLWGHDDSYGEQYIYDIRKRLKSGNFIGRYHPHGEKYDRSVYAFEENGPYYTWEYWALHFGTDQEKQIVQESLERMKYEARD